MPCLLSDLADLLELLSVLMPMMLEVSTSVAYAGLSHATYPRELSLRYWSSYSICCNIDGSCSKGCGVFPLGKFRILRTLQHVVCDIQNPVLLRKPKKL